MQPDTNRIIQIVHHLIDQAAASTFRGIDPYDFAETTSGIPHGVLSKLSFLNKISPVNFRPLLGIRPTDNAKANGLWLMAMVKLDMEKYEREITYLLQWITNNAATEFSEFSMGFSFRMALSRYASGPGKTSLIISLFILYALIERYAKTGDGQLLEKILSFERLLGNTWMKFETDHTCWYSYLPGKKDEVYNATAKVGRFYAALYAIHPEDRYLQTIRKIMTYLQGVQQPDGHWPYSALSPYVDHFHTAFVLESIHDMLQVVDQPAFRQMFNTGFAYYRRHCFTQAGIPLHFSALHKPADIRNSILGTEIRDCANAILLLSKTAHLPEATAVVNWTIDKFYHRKQHFSFYRNSVFANHIHFIRWQSWMALALTEYLQGSK